jgi:hypothetical protein
MNSGDPWQSGSYEDVRGRLLQQLRAAHVSDRVFELIQAAVNAALAEDNLVLSQVEKRRLLADVLKTVLEEMNKRLGP